MNTLDRVILYDLEDRLKGELGVDDVTLDLAYSGRSMFGNACVGFVCDDIGDLRIALKDIAAAEPDEELAELADMFATQSPSSDSMGRSVIAYWPDVKSIPIHG